MVCGVLLASPCRRCTATNVTWLPGKPTPMHFHGKDAIAVYLETGALKATTAGGQSVVNEYAPGFTNSILETGSIAKRSRKA